MASKTETAKKSENSPKKRGYEVPELNKGGGQKKTAPKSGSTQKKGTQKGGTAKKNGGKNAEAAKKAAAKRQQLAIVFFALTALFLCLAFIRGEAIWTVIHNGFFRVFGWCGYALPVALCYLGVTYTREKGKSSAGLYIFLGSLIAFICSGITHIFWKKDVLGEGGKYLVVTELSDQIKDIWNYDSPKGTGGIVGIIAGGLPAKYIGQTGTLIIEIILLIVVLLFVTGGTPAGIARMISVPVGKIRELIREKAEANAEKNSAAQEKRKQDNKESRPKKTTELRHFVFGPRSGDNKGEADEEDDTEGIITDSTTFTAPAAENAEPAEDSGTQVEAEAADSSIDIFFNGSVVPSGGRNQTGDFSVPIFGTAGESPAGNVPGKSGTTQPAQSRRTHTPKTVQSETVTAPAQPEKAPESLVPGRTAYTKPSVDCLEVRVSSGSGESADDIKTTAQKLVATLESFGVKASVVGAATGPSVTRYDINPDEGVRISKITKLADDLALRLATSGVRIAAIPNQSAIGIEVPNKVRETVGLRELIDSDQFRGSKSRLNVALGKDIAGNFIFADLAKMPHLLIAGTTGSGKSVCLNTMIVSILYNASPDEVKLVLIDPKMVEFSKYNGIAHLEVPVVSKPRKAAGALSWAVTEMERRYQLFADNGVSDIKGYNKLAETKLGVPKLHQTVIFIDELSDLMMVAPNEVEDSICRLAQMARAAGMHLVVATQRPSVNVITGVIKANIPSRIALSVSSQIDSRTILDATGAEKLLGNGDMLFAPIGSSKPQRLQGCFVTDEEIESVVEHIKRSAETQYNDDVIKEIDSLAAASEDPKRKGSSSAQDDGEGGGMDESVYKALEVLIKAGKASTTFLQNKLGWGYPKAARVMSELEEMGFIAPKDGNKERRVLITLQQLYEMNAASDGSADEPSGLSGDYAAEDFEEEADGSDDDPLTPIAEFDEIMSDFPDDEDGVDEDDPFSFR